jgi:lysophospholipase L1-like esterase
MYDIVMIGSSIFEFWQQPKWGKLNVANHAIRSTQSQDWMNKNLNQLPDAKAILLYCGSNDLIYGVPPRQTVLNIKGVLASLHQLQPNAMIGYFSIMKCPQKKAANQLAIIDNINQQINDFIETNDSCNHPFHYFNFNDYITNDSKWFIEDGLHLTPQAYQNLDLQLTSVIPQWLEAIK